MLPLLLSLLSKSVTEKQNGKDSKAFQMVNYNLTPLTATIDDSACLKPMVIVKDPPASSVQWKK
jgi:hypothetical protein